MAPEFPLLSPELVPVSSALFLQLSLPFTLGPHGTKLSRVLVAFNKYLLACYVLISYLLDVGQTRAFVIIQMGKFCPAQG